MTAGLVAAFSTEQGLRNALPEISALHAGHIVTYTPRSLEDEPKGSPVPSIILVAGLLGAAGGFGLQAYADVVSYPLDIGGRPLFSWPAYVPIAFEIGILCAIIAGFCGFLIVNRMPRLHEPVDELAGMREASRDGWLLALRSDDASAIARARLILGRLHAASIQDLPS
jgi:hypothetical protein